MALNFPAILFTFLWAAQVPPAVSSTRKISWSSELGLTSLSSIEASLSNSFANLGEWGVILENGKKLQVKNCHDFLAATKQLKEVEEGYVMDFDTLEMTGAHCFALEALKTANVPSKTYLSWFRFSAANIARLTPTLIMSEMDGERLAAKAEKACISWSKFEKPLKIQVETPDQARLSSDGWTGRLTLYGRGDFDDDGIEDLLIRRDAHVIGGTEAETTIYIITQPSKKRCLKTIRVMGLGYSFTHPLN